MGWTSPSGTRGAARGNEPRSPCPVDAGSMSHMAVPPAHGDGEPERADQSQRHPGGHWPIEQPARRIAPEAAAQARIERRTLDDEAQVAALGALQHMLQRTRDRRD